MKSDHIKTVAVVGAGTMGQGIAQVFAGADFNVQLYDVQPNLVSQSVTSIGKSVQALVDKQKMSADQAQTLLKKISALHDLKDVKADLVVEAIVEKLDIKRKLFLDLENIVGQEAILTTNTSSIPVTQIASVLKSPQRFAGLHFFNPATLMKLVEIVKGSSTQQQTIDVLFDICARLGKRAVLTQDSPGFIVNRVARHYYVESLKALEENVAAHEAIDKLLRSAGFRMGPFELMDLIGVDVNFSVTSSMFESFHHDAKFRPSRIQQQKVDAGHHGRKTGKGFYDYTK